jgi:ArsR family transcriptional regulator
VQGDFTALPFADASFDTLLMHQVLHYAQAPETVLAQAARVARPGAFLAIVDLASHAHEELRTTHAHARLGFSDEQMAQWFAAAGFSAEAPLALEGGQLTVKIWTGRRITAPITAKVSA